MDSDTYPIGLSKNEEGASLEIQWSNGQTQQVSARALRAICPCATCREKAEASQQKPQPQQLRILTDAEWQPLRVVRMSPAGSYAYLVEFSDGHRSGVFPFELLHRAGEPTGNS